MRPVRLAASALRLSRQPLLCGDDTNAKPNYLSVMNYRYQFTGITLRGHGRLQSAGWPTAGLFHPGLTGRREHAGVSGSVYRSELPRRFGDPGLGLNEPAGLGSGVADIFTFTDARETGIPRVAASTGPVDWNGDGAFTSLNVQADTNCGPAGFGDHDCHYPQYPQLKGHADWGPAGQNSFTYKFQCTPFGGPQGDGASTAPFVQHEMSTQMAIQAHVALPPRSVKIAIRPGCSGKEVAPGQPGTVSVALLGSNDFDVAEVDPASLEFPRRSSSWAPRIQDIDGDGKPDLVATFETRKHEAASERHVGEIERLAEEQPVVHRGGRCHRGKHDGLRKLPLGETGARSDRSFIRVERECARIETPADRSFSVRRRQE